MTENTLKDMNFEEALQELETIVRSLETGQGGLERSITAYERGVALKKHCEEKLSEAQSKIEKISVSSNGDVKVEPFDAA